MLPQDIICRGSVAIGTACNRCQRCLDEYKALAEARAEQPDAIIARRIIQSVIKTWHSSFDLRILRDTGEWDKNEEEIDKQHDRMSKLLEEADRFLVRTKSGKWNDKDVEWLEKFLV